MPQENLSMLPSLFKFQACKSCNAQLYFGMISSSSWETGNIGLLQVSSPCLSFHFFLLLYCAFFFFFPPFLFYMCKTETIWRRSVARSREETGGWVGGQGGDDGAEGGLGLQSLKISRAAERKAGPRHSSGIPSISAILVAFSISEVCLIS